MSSSADYAKLKVTELRDALLKRNLPTVGVKSELVARLVAADASADAPSPAANKSHLPTADDYDVDWDDNDDPTPAAAPPPTTTSTAAAVATATTAAPSTTTAAAAASEPTSAAAAPASAGPAKPKKKFASIAALFDTAPPATAAAPAKSKDAAATQNSQSPSSPSTVTDEAATSTTAAPAATTSAPKPDEPSFAAGLSASTLDVELERRKARAKRFGIDDDAAVTEATKKLEREKRFGNAAAEDAPEKKEAVKGLDSALPDRRDRKRGAPPAQDTRAGKRTRPGNNGAGRAEQRGGQQQQQQQQQRRAQAPAAGVQKKGYKPVLDDPAEKAKAEARARKFGVA